MPDVTLPVVIPEGIKQEKTIAAWTAQSDTDGIISFTGNLDDNGKDYVAHAHFRIPIQQPGESLPDFGLRFLRAIGIASVKAHGQKVADDINRVAVDAVVLVENDVPDDVLE